MAFSDACSVPSNWRDCLVCRDCKRALVACVFGSFKQLAVGVGSIMGGSRGGVSGVATPSRLQYKKLIQIHVSHANTLIYIALRKLCIPLKLYTALHKTIHCLDICPHFKSVALKINGYDHN